MSNFLIVFILRENSCTWNKMMKTIAKTTVILICIILFNIQPILNRYYK